MQLQIEATEHIVEIEGVQCRLWEGTTVNGVPCKVFIHRIAVANDDDQSQFDEELREMPAPRLPAIPLSAIL